MRDDKMIKCGRCGNWIPISEWKYAPPRVIHDNCPAIPAKAQQAPHVKLLRRRDGIEREIR